eukprot:TRINITY_DN646_c3_g1_i2.p1 TRINITY_DN646_c3_g1~~TRINITY_DN646_c3_g1_i2.p1  ORF type:complete len:421 (+),score=99.11 TRINITY_DN646_c3_g1_i2:59-1264(+)
MDMMSMPINEPPPLLSAEYVRNEANGFAQEQARQKKSGGMQRDELSNILNIAMTEINTKGRHWDGQLTKLESKFSYMQHQNNREREEIQQKLMEIQKKVMAVSTAIEHHLLFVPALSQAAEHVLAAHAANTDVNMLNRNTIDENCRTAINKLAGFSKAVSTPTGGSLQPIVLDCLEVIGRTDVVSLGVNPTPALLSYCHMLMGTVAMKAGQYETAVDLFAQALKADETAHPLYDELVKLNTQATDLCMGGEEQPTTPRTSPRRQHFFTPPPSRSMNDIEGELPRGAVTPGTGHNWGETGSPYLSFPRPWASSHAHDTTPSPAPPAAQKVLVSGGGASAVPAAPRPKVDKYCYNCKATENLKICSKCKKVCFCSVECQKIAWETRHSEECEEFAIGANSITA